MRIKKTPSSMRKNAVKASRTVARRRVRAGEEIAEVGEVSVDPEATDLLFEAEDVAELVAEVTGEEVTVSADEDAVVFEVGEEEFVVEPEGNEEILEATRKTLRGKRTVKASTRTRRPAGRPAPARRGRR